MTRNRKCGAMSANVLLKQNYVPLNCSALPGMERCKFGLRSRCFDHLTNTPYRRQSPSDIRRGTSESGHEVTASAQNNNSAPARCVTSQISATQPWDWVPDVAHTEPILPAGRDQTSVAGRPTSHAARQCSATVSSPCVIESTRVPTCVQHHDRTPLIAISAHLCVRHSQLTAHTAAAAASRARQVD